MKWALTVVVTLLLGPQAAEACKFGLPERHLSDETRRATDSQPPRFTSPPTITMHRGMVPEGTGCGGASTDSCSDIGRIRIIVPASDDQTPANEVGFRLQLISGTLPRTLQFPDHDIRAFNGEILLSFGEENAEDSLSFVLSVAPVDAAANVGDSVMLPVSDGTGGCSVAPGRPGTWLVVGLLAFWGGLRRRR